VRLLEAAVSIQTFEFEEFASQALVGGQRLGDE